MVCVCVEWLGTLGSIIIVFAGVVVGVYGDAEPELQSRGVVDLLEVLGGLWVGVDPGPVCRTFHVVENCPVECCGFSV